MTSDIIPAISHGAFTATPTGLLIDDKQEIPYELWEAYGKALRRVEGAIQWVIGDWLNYGERRYGETYAQAVDQQQVDSWKNYKWVAAKVKPSTRVESLSWSHHREIAHLPDDEQAAMLYLARERELSVRQLGAFANGHDPDRPYDPKAWARLWKKACKYWYRKYLDIETPSWY